MFTTGDVFPGPVHGARIKRYRRLWQLQKALYEAASGVRDLAEILPPSDYGREQRKIKSEVQIIANLPRLIMKKRAGMVARGLAYKADDKALEAIQRALAVSDWGAMKRRVVYRASCYGNAIITPRRTDAGDVILDSRDPWTWFPDVDPLDPSEASAHVFAWVRRFGDEAVLFQERYEAGQIIRTAHYVDAMEDHAGAGPDASEVTVGREFDASILPGYEGFRAVDQVNSAMPLVANIRNWHDAESVYGESDLGNGNESLVFELTNRLSQIAHILDMHADPKFTGPEAAMRIDPNTGVATLDISGSTFLGREHKDDPEFKYLTWESQLDHAFAEVREIASYLCVAMEMSPELVGLATGTSTSGQAEATETLRIRSYNTISGVEDMRAFVSDGLQHLGALVLDLSNVKYTEPPSVEFGDPLPLSDTERTASIAAKRMAGIVSLDRAVRLANPELLEDEIAAEVERIRNEEFGSFNPGMA